MKLKFVRPLAPLACVALAACHIPGMPSAKAPTGQVVATVDGDEITLAELRAELAGAPQPSNAQAAKAIQEAALQQIVVRKILAKAAEKQKMDKSPDFAIQKKRGIETLLSQMIERQYASAVPQVSEQEAATYISEHPAQFADRKIYVVDELRVPAPKDPADLKALQPLHSLADIESLAASKGWEVQRSVGVLDSATVPPAMMDKINALPPGEPFVVPGPGAAIVNVVRDSKSAPITGATATKIAMNLVKNQKTRESVGKSVQNLVKSEASKVKYNDAYKPEHPLGADAPAPKAPEAAPPKP